MLEPAYYAYYYPAYLMQAYLRMVYAFYNPKFNGGTNLHGTVSNTYTYVATYIYVYLEGIVRIHILLLTTSMVCKWKIENRIFITK